MGELFDLDRLDDSDPFEIDRQAAHLFKHDPYGIDDIAGQVLMVPLAPSGHNDPTRCRPIGCYVAAKHLADRFAVAVWDKRLHAGAAAAGLPVTPATLA